MVSIAPLEVNPCTQCEPALSSKGATNYTSQIKEKTEFPDMWMISHLFFFSAGPAQHAHGDYEYGENVIKH